VTPQAWVMIASAVIASCALWFSIWQAAQQRRHNRLSVKPHLATWTYRDPQKGTFKVELINNGLGPAHIERFSLELDGVGLSENPMPGLENFLNRAFPNTPYRATVGSVEGNYVMAPKEIRTIIELQFLKAPFPTKKAMDDAVAKLEIEVGYRSFYDEKLHFSSKEEKADRPFRMIVLEHGPFG
jgi:hypothetical protein